MNVKSLILNLFLIGVLSGVTSVIKQVGDIAQVVTANLEHNTAANMATYTQDNARHTQHLTVADRKCFYLDPADVRRIEK